MNTLLLALSILLSTGRNLLSKSLSSIRFGTQSFFLCQSVLFASGACTVAIVGSIALPLRPESLLLSLFYGILLVIAQWLYTAALSRGSTALCSTVYSMGFILPTLSGALLFGEALDALDYPGIACAVLAVAVSGLQKKQPTHAAKSAPAFSLILAMLASGGLGIVQKLWQVSPEADRRGTFLFLAFLLAAALSLVAARLTKAKASASTHRISFVFAASVGLFFGVCNFLNTHLAGSMESAVFFPTLNIGIILLSMLCGIVFYRERLQKRDFFVLLLGASAILCLNLG
jgi:drug/metabolite transporter (DMT)-like permease